MINKRQNFKASDLRKVASAPLRHMQPDFIGDVVVLNSGGPTMLVVDIDGECVTVAHRHAGIVYEHKFPRPCLTRLDAA